MMTSIALVDAILEVLEFFFIVTTSIASDATVLIAGVHKMILVTPLACDGIRPVAW